MSLLSMLTQAIVVRNYAAGAPDEYGDAVTSFGEPITYPGRLEQQDSKEVTVGRDTVITDFRVFLPPDCDIGPFDQVIVEGNTFQVVGLPILESAPVGPPSHIMANLRWVQ